MGMMEVVAVVVGLGMGFLIGWRLKAKASGESLS